MNRKSLILLSILMAMAAGCGSRGTSSPAADPVSATVGQQVPSAEQTAVPFKQTEAPEQTTEPLPSLPPLPDTIALHFQPLTFTPLELGSADPAWKKLNTLPFGSDKQGNMTLTVYEESRDDAYFPKQWNGVLEDGKRAYLIRDLSSAFGEVGGQQETPTLYVFNRFFAGQERYKLIGTIEGNGNGPGLINLVIEDTADGEVVGVDHWGTPEFVDLDGDGADEFIIAFPGLHLSWPDLTIIRQGQDGLEAADSMLQSVRRNQGDFASLLMEADPPVIRISNIMSEQEPIYDYTYRDGVLTRKK